MLCEYTSENFLRGVAYVALTGVVVSQLVSPMNRDYCISFSSMDHEPGDFVLCHGTLARLSEPETKVANINKLDKFSEYEKNWNGYDADPISKDVIKNSKNIINFSLAQPKVFLTNRSTVQLEWDFIDGKYLEIEVFDSKYSVYKDYDHSEEEYETSDLKKCMEEINVYST